VSPPESSIEDKENSSCFCISLSAIDETHIRPGQARFVCKRAIELEFFFFAEFKHVDTGTFLGSSQSTGCKYTKQKARLSGLSIHRIKFKCPSTK